MLFVKKNQIFGIKFIDIDFFWKFVLSEIEQFSAAFPFQTKFGGG